MHAAVEFEFWPGDMVTNKHGETGLVSSSSLQLDGSYRHYVEYPGHKGNWHYAGELTKAAPRQEEPAMRPLAG